MSGSLPVIGGIEDFMRNAGVGINQAIQHPGQAIVNQLPTIGGIVGGIGGGIAGGVADIPTGVIPGAVAGGVVGATAGGAAGTGAQQYLQKRSFNPLEIAGNAALMGGGELLGAGVGALAKPVFSKVGSAIGKYGVDLTTKALKLTPKMANDLTSGPMVGGIGEKLSTFLGKRGLQGADHGAIDTYTQGVQNQFDQIAKNPNIKINTADVAQGFLDEINRLKGSVLPEVQAKATAVQQAGLNFINKFGDQPIIDAPTLTADRQSVDAMVKKFAGNPDVMSTANSVRNIYQQAIREADPTQSLEPLGSELQKLYNLLKVTGGREAATTPGNSGLSQGVRALVANGLFGPVGGAVSLLADKVLGTKAATALESGAAKVGGSAISGLGKTLPIIGGALGVTASSQQKTNNDTTNNSSQHITDITTNLEQNPPEIANDVARDSKTGHWSVPTDIPKFSVPAADNIMTLPQYQKAQEDYQKAVTEHASIPQYVAADEAWMKSKQSLWDQSQQIRQNAIGSRLTPDAINFMQEYPNDLQNANALKDIIKKYGSATGVQNFSDLIKYAEANNDPQVGVALGMMNQQQAAQTHQTLGRVTNFDINFLQNTPSPTDSLGLALAKIDKFGKQTAIYARQYGGPYQYMLDQGLTNSPGMTSGGLPSNPNGYLPIQK